MWAGLIFLWNRFYFPTPKCARTRARSFLLLLLIIVGCCAWKILFATRHCEIDEATIDQTRRIKTASPRTVPFHEFIADQPRSVVILSYMRSGSSFLGQLFNQNPSAFYTYEPLDSLYADMYGVTLAIPSDITTYSNGQPRTVPDIEVREQFQFLEHLLTCNLASLPTTFFARNFLTRSSKYTVPSNYFKCLDMLKESNYSWLNCQVHNPWLCGRHFGEQPESRLNICNGLLTSKTYQPDGVPAITRKRYAKYRTCMTKFRQHLDENCMPLLTTSCNKKPVRATKVLRASMRSMEELLAKTPNVRVVHLIRDPRDVVLSRRDSGSKFFYSMFTRDQDWSNFTTNEARIYCKAVVDDIKIRLKLEQMFPGKLYQITYEELVGNLQHTAVDIHYFMNLTISGTLQAWLNKQQSKQSNNSTAITSRWRTKLSFQQNNDVVNVCKELFELVGYNIAY